MAYFLIKLKLVCSIKLCAYMAFKLLNLTREYSEASEESSE